MQYEINCVIDGGKKDVDREAAVKNAAECIERVLMEAGMQFMVEARDIRVNKAVYRTIKAEGYG